MRARCDFSNLAGQPGPVAFSDPDRVVVATSVGEVPAAMEEIERALGEGCWAAGWIAYEAAAAFDPALTTRRPQGPPLVAMGLFRAASSAPPLRSARLEAGALIGDAAWTPRVSAAAHASGIAAIREAIAAGDTYQINYTFPIDAAVPNVPVEQWYERLAGAARAPWPALIEMDDWAVLSLSPELFFRIERQAGGRRLITQPMKGTAPRGRWPGEDEARRRALAASEKDRAENVMIVDLCRNDLSRVCEVGSVRATSLFDVVRYPTVWQMVSTVEGVLRPDARLTDVFAAAFPAGSITGAPKASSMRLIAALEPAPRGVYCGAVGWAAPDGRAAFNVAIRTITIDRRAGRAVYGVGGGITWDSAAGDEHAEAMAKAACLTPPAPFGLFETLRLESGQPIRLDRHLDRLAASAAFLDFTCPLDRIRGAVAEHAAAHAEETRRLRIELATGGAFNVSSRPLDPTPPAPVVALASSPVDASDVRLFHKTTHRDIYDRHRREHPGAFDVLLWNPAGEITEFTTGNVVVEIDGRALTPPVGSGLLAGVLRQELLDAGEIHEARLTVAGLARATRIWFINSLRGRRLVSLRASPART